MRLDSQRSKIRGGQKMRYYADSGGRFAEPSEMQGRGIPGFARVGFRYRADIIVDAVSSFAEKIPE